MVAQLAITPIATAVGEFAAPYLLRKAGEIGLTRFIQVYGGAAAASIGIQKTQPVDLQTEKIMGMPVSHITGQGEVYDDIDYSAIDEDREVEPLKYIDTVHGGKGPLEPIKAKGFPAETEVKKWDESFKAPEKIETTKGLEIPSQEKVVPPGFETPDIVDTSILTKDITKQTKDLVKEEPEFGALTRAEKKTARLEKGDKPDFYSRAIKSIEDAKPDKLTKTKWKSYIQSTKEELDYLGLTKFLKGNESITKQELLDFVKGKDLAATMTVRSVPKDQMNPMWKDYSLGGEQQEHTVFQIGKDKGEVGQLFKSEHYNTEYGTGNFAWARTQVGFDADASPKYDDLDSEVSELFDNTLIIDEIQSDWIQKGQDKGFVSDFDIVPEDKLIEYFKKNKIFYKLSEVDGNPVVEWQKGVPIKDGDAPLRSFLDSELNPDYIFNKSDKTHYETLDAGQINQSGTNDPIAYLIYRGIVPDLPLKDSKKFVELVLNEMIRKAVKDGRDSIAITNGQIQYNRYEAMGDEERQGLKKFYDTFVYDQLNKIAKNYNVKLERIDISEGEAPQELQNIHLGNQIKRAQDNEYKLEKITLQELWDRTKDTNIPGHAALYSDRGVGQGANYIEDYLNELVDNRAFSPATGTGSGLDKWNEIKNNEVYIWKKKAFQTEQFSESEFIEDKDKYIIGWELPIVPVQDAANYAKDSLLPELLGNDLGSYKKYIQDAKPPKGEEINPEQLIKMKLPKKLQKKKLSESQRLTKVEQQTDRMFG